MAINKLELNGQNYDLGSIKSIQGKTGEVSLSPTDIGAIGVVRANFKIGSSGWYRVAKIPEASAWSLKFKAFIETENYLDNVSSYCEFIISKEVNPSGLDTSFRQLDSKGILFDAVRTVYYNNEIWIDIHISVDPIPSDYQRNVVIEISNYTGINGGQIYLTDGIKVGGFAQNPGMPAVPNSVNTYNIVLNAGIVADRAIADENNYNIAEHFNSYPYSVKKFVNPSSSGWMRLLKISYETAFNGLFQITHHADTSPSCEFSFFASLIIHSGGSYFTPHITQLSGSTLNTDIDKCRVGRINDANFNGFVIDVYTTCPNRMGINCSSLCVPRPETGFELVGEIVDDEPTEVYEYEFFQNAGLVADKALTVVPAAFKTHEVTALYNISTNEGLDAAINDAYNNAYGYGYFEFILSVNAPGLALPGGRWYFQGYKDADINYGWIRGEIYQNASGKVKRIKYNGTWWDWIQESFTYHTVESYIYSSNIEEITTWLDNIYLYCPDRSYYEGAIGINTGDFDIPGGIYHVSGYRWAGDTGGYQELKGYMNDSLTSGIRYYTRSRVNGGWTPWRNMIS